MKAPLWYFGIFNGFTYTLCGVQGLIGNSWSPSSLFPNLSDSLITFSSCSWHKKSNFTRLIYAVFVLQHKSSRRSHMKAFAVIQAFYESDWCHNYTEKNLHRCSKINSLTMNERNTWLKWPDWPNILACLLWHRRKNGRLNLKTTDIPNFVQIMNSPF